MTTGKSKSKSNSHRRDVDLRRRQDKEADRAREEEQHRDEAEQWARNFQREVRRYNQRRIGGWILAVLGVAVFVTHIMEHSGTFSLMSPGMQDLFIGYPTGAVLLLAAVILLGQVHPAERRR